jgi:SAM-dependent methyltransferase
VAAPRGGAGLSAIHRAAAVGFARSAEAYERGRPGYPDAAVDRLVAALPGSDVVDLAAGTGKLTRALVARGLDVAAVEPVAEMRAAIAAPARVLDGTAEAIPLPAGSADGVTVAQAFHWFDGPRALAEIHRVLRPGGVLALLWNRRRMQDAIHERLQALLAPHRGSTPAHRDERWRATLAGSSLFGPLREEVFANEQVLDAGGLADRIGSISFVASLGDDERAALLDEVRALAADGPVTLRYDVELQLATRF